MGSISPPLGHFLHKIKRKLRYLGPAADFATIFDCLGTYFYGFGNSFLVTLAIFLVVLGHIFDGFGSV